MKALALVLAAVLGSGCVFVDDDCTGTVSLEWDFRLANGNVPAGTISQICAAAGVAFVDVYLNGQFAGGFSCLEAGATIVDIPEGRYLFTVEGVDASELIRYRHEFEVDSRCGDQLLAVRPAAGFVDLNYSLPGGVCATSPTFMHYDIRDEITGRLVPTAQSLTPTTCPQDIVPALPAGTYTLEWMEERSSSNLSFSAVLGRDCTFRGFDVAGGQLTEVPVGIVSAEVACPHFQ
jgi:hypothetical protein